MTQIRLVLMLYFFMVAHKAAYQTPSKAFLRSLHVPVEEDCTGGLVIEVFDDSDKVGADVVLLHGCPQSCMPNLVEGLLEVRRHCRGLAGSGDIFHRECIG